MLLQQCLLVPGSSGIHGVGSGEEGKMRVFLRMRAPLPRPRDTAAPCGSIMPNMIWHYTTAELHGMARVRRMRIEKSNKQKKLFEQCQLPASASSPLPPPLPP